MDAVDIEENMNIQQQTWRTEPAQQKTKWKWKSHKTKTRQNTDSQKLNSIVDVYTYLSEARYGSAQTPAEEGHWY